MKLTIESTETMVGMALHPARFTDDVRPAGSRRVLVQNGVLVHDAGRASRPHAGRHAAVQRDHAAGAFVSAGVAKASACCFCGERTAACVYTREDPTLTRCRGEGPEHAEP